MNDEVLHMKQRYLSDICGKMHQLAHLDAPNRAAYDDLYPDVFCRFSGKNTRQRMLRKPKPKPKPQKLAVDFAALSRPIAKSDILLDLNGCRQAPPAHQDVADEVAVLTTRLGQQWLVRRADRGGGVMSLTYCDGSSSLLTETDANTLGVTFSAVPRKWASE
jgi:hypothetical protein